MSKERKPCERCGMTDRDCFLQMNKRGGSACCKKCTLEFTHPVVDETKDEINPAHYQRFPVEVIDITEHLNFNKGSAVKYLARAGHKPGVDELTDLEKACWYVAREIERVRQERANDRDN